MYEIEVISAAGFLGSTCLAAGDVRKCRAYFDRLLDRGVVLASATATVTSSHSTVSAPTLSDDKKSVIFYVTATSIAEEFTLALQVVTGDAQTLNYTLAYEITAPVVS